MGQNHKIEENGPMTKKIDRRKRVAKEIGAGLVGNKQKKRRKKKRSNFPTPQGNEFKLIEPPTNGVKCLGKLQFRIFLLPNTTLAKK